MGVTLRAIGDPQRAMACFRRAIEEDKDYAPAYLGLGLASASAGDPKLAIDYMRQFLDLEPNSPYSDETRAEIRRLEAKSSSKRQLKTYAVEGTALSFRYPDDWVAMTPEEVKRQARGNTVLTPNCVLVVANPEDFGQNVNIQISASPGHNVVPPAELEELGQALTENMAKQLTGFQSLSRRIIEVADVPALEMNFSSVAWGKRQRQRSVGFVKNEKLYTITCTALDADFVDAEAQAFSFIVDTITVTEKK